MTSDASVRSSSVPQASTDPARDADPGRCSFLLPAWGFDSRAAARAFYEGPSFPPSFLFRRDEVPGPFYARRAYVPRLGMRFSELSTGLLSTSDLPGAGGYRGEKPLYLKLRVVGADRPRDGSGEAFNVAILVEGPRRFFRTFHRTAKRPSWWYRLAEGDRDCYAAWCDPDGASLDPGMPFGEGVQAFAMRSARGVLYAREVCYDDRGHPNRVETTVVGVDFSILDRQAGKDDLLRVSAFRLRGVSFRPDQVDEPDLGRFEPVWHALVARARAGFERCCQPVDPATEAWRTSFFDQRAKAEADRRAHGNRQFDSRARLADWKEALDLVEEPWQLSVVIAAHSGCQTFWDVPGNYPGSQATNVRKMFEAYRAAGRSPERLAAFEKMLADYVLPASGRDWNYTGD